MAAHRATAIGLHGVSDERVAGQAGDGRGMPNATDLMSDSVVGTNQIGPRRRDTLGRQNARYLRGWHRFHHGEDAAKEFDFRLRGYPKTKLCFLRGNHAASA